MKFIYILVAFFFAFNAQTQEADLEKSIIYFSVGEKASGTIQFASIDLKFNKRELPSFIVEIDPSTINTGNGMRDGHLQKKTFFDVKQYGNITFTSTSVEKEGNNFIAIGLLKMKSIEKEIKLKFNIIEENEQKVFIGFFDINRTEYNLGEKYKGDGMVPFEVKTEIRCYIK